MSELEYSLQEWPARAAEVAGKFATGVCVWGLTSGAN